MEKLLTNHRSLIEHIIYALQAKNGNHPFLPPNGSDLRTASAVMFLLGRLPQSHPHAGEACVILTKRSAKVKQPGDLCCPGGSVAPRFDRFLAKLLGLPFFALGRWPLWPDWLRTKPQAARMLALLFATSLRESVEEMRLNPFGVRFLGLLPPQPLVLFERVIYPLVCWTQRQQRFFPNWEVARIVYIPLRDLLNPENYFRYRLRMASAANPQGTATTDDFPCFRHTSRNETELLWGATYRITTVFLHYVLHFTPPEPATLPIVKGSLDETYLTGQK